MSLQHILQHGMSCAMLLEGFWHTAHTPHPGHLLLSRTFCLGLFSSPWISFLGSPDISTWLEKTFTSQTLNLQRWFPWLSEWVPWSPARHLTSLWSPVHQPDSILFRKWSDDSRQHPGFCNEPLNDSKSSSHFQCSPLFLYLSTYKCFFRSSFEKHFPLDFKLLFYFLMCFFNFDKIKFLFSFISCELFLLVKKAMPNPCLIKWTWYLWQRLVGPTWVSLFWITLFQGSKFPSPCCAIPSWLWC